MRPGFAFRSAVVILLGTAAPPLAAADLCELVAKHAPAVLGVAVDRPKADYNGSCTVAAADKNTRYSLTASISPGNANGVPQMRQFEMSQKSTERTVTDEPSVGSSGFAIRERFGVTFHFAAGNAYRRVDVGLEGGYGDAHVARAREFAKVLARY